MKEFSVWSTLVDTVRLMAGAMVLGLAMVPAMAHADAAIDTLYQAAKAEGKVSVMSAPSAPLRKELTDAFAKRFPGVELEIQGLAADAAVAKLKTEQRAGVHSVDVILTGATTGVIAIKPAKLLRRLDPMITSAEVRDPSKWMGGVLDWVDDEKYVLAMTTIALPPAMYNTDLVKSGELTSDKDLLDPKWKGKIVFNDPSVPGAAYIIFRQFYDLHGEEYLRAFMKQDPVVTRDLRQIVDWVAKGNYAIGVGYSSAVVNQFLEQGVKTLGVDTYANWQDPIVLSPGFGGLMMPLTVPHSAAAQLFVNWVLTQEGQTAVVKGLFYASRRLDVSQDPVPQFIRPIPGRAYTAGYTEAWTQHPNDKKVRELFKELKIGGR